ncbi:FAD/NAD(P)-binding protein [Actinocorallia libanotica]|uniref:FAD/NAD(P)-binding protein n=1 Tax=Actinocorallia libanotica TaxID=46162 RepID=A0ABN1Q6G4_9ACTN
MVVIVGGGASGTLTAVHVLRAFRHGAPRLVMIDKDGRHGLGQAYSTGDSRHLLNACTARMSALADEPEHLLDWVRARGLDAADTDYLPRRLYGEYLRSVLAEARASRPGSRVEEVTGAVVSLTTGERPVVRLADGRAFPADAVVLATGNRPPAAWPHLRAGDRYVPDAWAPGALDGRGDGSPVLVVGTGLTMVDLAVTLTGAHPGTVVHAVSRHGLLPARHRCPQPPPRSIPLPEGPLTLAVLMRTVRAAIRANGGEWHAIIDGLRPHVPSLWERLPEGDRRRFLTLASRYWEIHRHRIPPETAARVDALRDSGRLRVLRGEPVSATDLGDGVLVGLDTPEGPRELRVGHVVNGTGPARDLAADPFLHTLFLSGAARPDSLGLGLDATAEGALLDAAGRPHERVFTLGPPLRGLRYETTAIPEIRDQAAALAERLTRVDGLARIPDLLS